MATNCQFILKNNDFDYIDDELITEQLHCAFPHYNYGRGCSSCPIYRQLIETKNPQIEHNEEVQDDIQKWWV